jgi:RNA polymerase subunit RPABC4/transcription elongation factor Spt4
MPRGQRNFHSTNFSSEWRGFSIETYVLPSVQSAFARELKIRAIKEPKPGY